MLTKQMNERPIMEQHLEELARFSGAVSVVSEYWRSRRMGAEAAMERVSELVRELMVSRAYTKEGDLK